MNAHFRKKEKKLRSYLNLAFGICYRSILLPIDPDNYRGFLRKIAELCDDKKPKSGGKRVITKPHC